MYCESSCIICSRIMFFFIKSEKTERDILEQTPGSIFESISGAGAQNKLILGDNLPALRTLLDVYHGGVDLIYIDPPFATGGKFRIGADRANAISDSPNDELAYADTLVGAEFLEFLWARLVLLRELLSDRGSIYLHIDYKIGHYVKVLMDEVFGAKNFRNDISRVKCNPKNFQRRAYGNIKDMILFYSKSDNAIWNDPRIPFSEDDVDRLFRKTDAEGRRYTTVPLHAPGETMKGDTGGEWRGMKPPKGRHWRSSPDVLEKLEARGLIEWSANGVPRKKIFADESAGKKAQDIWEFKDPQYPKYPTQKSGNLLDFIVQASSNEGDLVLDCFCGSGTALLSAQALNRRWIGIDSSERAIAACRKRLAEAPLTLFQNSGYEFLEARPNTSKNLLTP